MTKLTVLSPRPKREPADESPGPGLASLQGAVVGMRTDYIWPEWDIVSAEWAQMLEADGALIRRWRAGHRSGEDDERTATDLEAFVSEVDLAIVGLGN
jgi:hypothetical protein